MGALQLAATMRAIAAALEEAQVVEKAWGYPKWAADVGECVVGYPERIEYDATMGGGSDRATFPVWRLMGLINEEDTQDEIDAYHAAAKAALESGEHGDLSDVVSFVHVPGCDIVPIELPGPVRRALVVIDCEVMS